MKSLLVLAGLLLTGLGASAQGADDPIPGPVLDHFMLLYPEARQLRWSSADDCYTATFKNQKHKTRVVFNANGTVDRIQAQIKVVALPRRASAYLTDKVKAKKIREASIIEDADQVITFEAEVVPAGDFVFDSEGDFIARKDHKP